MIRRSFRKPVLALALFPFLAVMVCTMGALIVLLVSVLQKAHADAANVVASKANQARTDGHLSELRLEKEDLEWRRSELERQRTEFQQQLVRQRLTLSHYEDHIRRLEEQWKQLTAQAEEFKRLGSQQVNSEDDTQGKLQALRTEIDQRRLQLADAKQKAAGRERTFAIIPYDGPNGTKRRPIYVECTDQGIVLQPEGIVLAPSDFEGSLGPGNPLDAALRTTREYLARYGGAQAHGEPYPLLIVRPNGAVAYSVARALKSWDDEFGYELVESEMKLAYPNPDAALKSELERSIADARQRQVVLASIMPGRFKQSGATGLVATTSGGFEVLGGSGGSPHGTGSAGRGTGSGVQGTGYGGQGTGSAGPGTGSAGQGTGSAGQGTGSAGQGTGYAGPMGVVPIQGAGFSKTFRDLAGDGDQQATSLAAAQQQQAKAKGGRGPGSRPGTAAGNATAIGTTAGPGMGTGDGTGTGPGTVQLPGMYTPRSAGSSANATAGQPGQPGQPANPGSSTQFASGQPGDPASAGGGGNQGGPNQNQGTGHKAPAGMKPIANARGSDWGLPNRGPTITGIQRYVQVECHADRLVLLQERGEYRAPTVIPMSAETTAAIEPFVSATWQRMEQWGIAGEGCFWKPILRVQVSPDAEQRFVEFATLLEGSGLVVQRK